MVLFFAEKIGIPPDDFDNDELGGSVANLKGLIVAAGVF
jgi:hypothetical protein